MATNDPKLPGASVTNLRVTDLDERVEAILADPDGYFAAARDRAWTIARAEVEAELARRARARSVPSPSRLAH